MIIRILILMAVGAIEEFINLLYYSMCYRQYKYATGLFQMIRVFIWYYVLKTIVTDIDNLWLILFYAIGGNFGDWLSLSIEPFVEKKILYIHKLFKKKKGRKKRGWWILSREKTRK